MKKTKTIDLRGNQYAQVKERLKEFRADCPNGKIETEPQFNQDGSLMFKAHILKDKADPNSAEATGHALGENKGQKAFEKLETIAVGRALALLGYAVDGEIASSEEMEEFLAYQAEKRREMIEVCHDRLIKCKNLDELKEIWAQLPVEARAEFEELKNELKKKYEDTNIPNGGGVDEQPQG